MLIIAGTLDLPPENRAKLLEAAEPLMRASEAEDGCDAYLMMPDPFDPGRVRIFERWQSEEALATHSPSRTWPSSARRWVASASPAATC